LPRIPVAATSIRPEYPALHHVLQLRNLERLAKGGTASEPKLAQPTAFPPIAADNPAAA
jgi:hypothetical protein